MASLKALPIRLEGALQAWGRHDSRYVVRATYPAPSKSGVAGLICCALGVDRAEAKEEWLPYICSLQMVVRIDRPGDFWWDYHTVGGGLITATAGGKTKQTAQLTRRQYLADASFLVFLVESADREDSRLDDITKALLEPKWLPFLGRKSCPPSMPFIENEREAVQDSSKALVSADTVEEILCLCPYPVRDPKRGKTTSPRVEVLIEWDKPADGSAQPSQDAEVWHDQPLCFEPPRHKPRLLIRSCIESGILIPKEKASSEKSDPKGSETKWKKKRKERLDVDSDLCVFCKSAGPTVHHTHYKAARGHEHTKSLRTLCRICHDAVTMLEYGLGRTLYRIDPSDIRWRDKILAKRKELLNSRSIGRNKKSRKKFANIDERADEEGTP